MITAIDIGATKTLIAQFGKTLQPVHEERFETSQDQVEFFNHLMERLQRLTDISTIVVGIAGTLNDKNVIVDCANIAWKNFDLRRALFQQFRCPVLLENDARLAALAEINALRPLPKLGLYLTISTGIGGSVVLNGKLIGALHNEPGHMMFNFEGQWQAWEDFASGSAFKQHFGHFAQDITNNNEWQEIGSRLSIGLGAVIPTLQPEIIVLGGGVGQYCDNYSHFITEQLRKRLPDFIAIPPIVTAKHPTEAVLYGCYYYAQHQKDSHIT